MSITVQGLVNKAYCLLEKENYELAIEVFNKAIAIQPENHELYVYLGEAYFLNRQYVEASKAFASRDELVLNNNPLTPYIKGYRGCIALNQGDLAQATKQLEKAISENVKEPEIYYHFAIAKMLQGHKKQAYEFLAKVDCLDPSFYFRKIKALLKQLA